MTTSRQIQQQTLSSCRNLVSEIESIQNEDASKLELQLASVSAFASQIKENENSTSVTSKAYISIPQHDLLEGDFILSMEIPLSITNQMCEDTDFTKDP